MKFWESYFTNANLKFIDITSKQIQYFSNTSKYFYIDQSDEAKLKEFAQKEGPFDIIIDDGGHANSHIIPSFKALFPFMNPGGMYIIEDLHCSYYKLYGGDDSFKTVPGTTLSFLMNLIDDVNYVGAKTLIAAKTSMLKKYPEISKNMTNFSLHIESIYFQSSLCIVTVM